MIKKELCYSTKLQDSTGISFKVEYYITKTSEPISDEKPSYGIIVKKLCNFNSCETYSVPSCFFHKHNADMLIHKLSMHSVTPIAAAECIDILLESCKFIY